MTQNIVLRNYKDLPNIIDCCRRRVILLTYIASRGDRFMQIKKSRFVAAIVACCVISGSVGALAATGTEKITAYLNHSIKFQVDGSNWTPKDSDGFKLAPVVYNGSTYLPARAVSEALGASIDWNSSSQTISITTGDSNAGIPYKDAQSNNNGSTSTTPGSSNGNSSTNTGSTNTPANNGKFYSTLPSGFKKDKLETLLHDQALHLIKLYGAALEDGDTSKLDKFVDTYVTEKTDKNYFLGRAYAKERIAGKVEGVREANSSDKIKEYSAAVKSIQSSELEFNEVNQYTEFVSVSFKFYPKGWNAFSSIYVSMSYRELSNGTYALEYISLY
ncbi:hypothetical protein EBB07_20685 [Paenibacillaceae bacterium]|nr:hypothetical protein EBB07_20685 [Paenibacillaceae bacterium]